MKERIPLAVRFWQKVQKGDGCWLWTGGGGRYGQIGEGGTGGRMLSAHVVSWEMENGSPVPKGRMVLHTCDEGKCVRPSHLYLGSHAKNMQDRAARGRNGLCGQRGEAHHRAKLSDADIARMLDLRSKHWSLTQIARHEGVSFQHVSKVVNGQRRAS